MQRLQHQHLEHHNRIVRRPAALRPVRADQRRLQVLPEHLEFHHPRQTLERIARHRQRLQPLVRIKETGLSRHHRLPSVPHAGSQTSAAIEQVFRGVQLHKPTRKSQHRSLTGAKLAMRTTALGLKAMTSSPKVRDCYLFSHARPASQLKPLARLPVRRLRPENETSRARQPKQYCSLVQRSSSIPFVFAVFTFIAAAYLGDGHLRALCLENMN